MIFGVYLRMICALWSTSSAIYWCVVMEPLMLLRIMIIDESSLCMRGMLCVFTSMMVMDCCYTAAEVKELWLEYENNSTPEAKFVKDLDKVCLLKLRNISRCALTATSLKYQLVLIW